MLSCGILFALLCGHAAASRHPTPWPNGPFHTEGPIIKDATGSPFVYVGINWPGEGEAMIPEGLQYSSIADIVAKIKSLKYNSVRMGWATEMVDDILDNGGDVTIKDTMTKVLGPQSASKIVAQILDRNPNFTENTTRLEVWDAVAAELARQHLHLVFNNHVSKAQWCCSPDDGNGWFGDTYFDIAKWKRSLEFMAKYAKKWPAATAFSLRNELRMVNSPANDTYGWSLWYDEMIDAANIVNAASPEALVIISGLNYDHELNPITAGEPISPSEDQRVFRLSDFDYADKIVFELHSYDNSLTNCTFFQYELYNRGFNALDVSPATAARNIAPVVLTEFGFAQNSSDYQGVYASCLKDFLTGDNRELDAKRIKGPIGHFEWNLGGSYYIREGIADHDDWWALLNHDWSDWRNHTVLNAYQKPLIRGTLRYRSV
ncbi:glycoside hydrolase superfamily [Aspergillus pseudoustus]|uniref:Glycoside hydrolase superfamily n=1 Tax=Aspergillus pseudoustus TaxID=1810923 RepID=A0ABR4JWV0_9EURO